MTGVVMFSVYAISPIRISYNESVEHQAFKGFGTSAAWWAQVLGNSEHADEIARLLYSEDGLNLDIYRFNVGAGEADNPNNRIHNTWRSTESFYVFSQEENKYVYDFSRDSAAVAMMEKALQYGAKEVIFFCNSPHYSMTHSGQASGGLTQHFSNLKKENYQDFAEYLLTIADYFYYEKNIPISYISPINEPQWGWGGDWVGQEGCFYTPEEAVELMEIFALKMQERNSPYKLSGLESGALGADQNDYIDKYLESEIINNFCDVYSGHSYWLDNNREAKKKAGDRFLKLYPDKELEMSEWCELPCKLDSFSIDSAIYMANIMEEDLNLLRAVSWQNWVAVNGYGIREDGTHISDGLISSNHEGTEIAINKRYYAYGHYSKFIPYGSVRIKSSISKSKLEGADLRLTSYKKGDSVILVIVNNSYDVKDIVLKKGGHKTMSHYATTDSKNISLDYQGEFNKNVTLESRSINTIVLKK